MVLFVIGPSGVGKTTLIKRSQEKLPAIIHVNVDDYIKIEYPELYHNAGNRWPEFWSKTLECFETNEREHGSSSSLCLLDVGAGSLQTQAALEYFSQGKNTLLIEDKPENIFCRNPHWPQKTQQSFESFKATEYSKLRKKIYKTCRYRLRLAGLTQEIAPEGFIKICESVMKI